MTKIRRLPSHHQKTALGLSFLAILAVVTVILLWPKKSAAPVNTAADTSNITITTTDGIALAATIKYPVATNNIPAVILLHEYGQDRHQWDPYLQRFLDAGFAVLSYDMRGFGDSRIASIPASQTEHLKSLPNDVPAVLEYLRAQSVINVDRISLIGASVGANTAFIANGLYGGVYRTVLLSPVDRDGSITAYGAKDFSPSNIFGLADNTEATTLDLYLKSVSGEKKRKIIPNGGHGIQLLEQSGVVDGIIQWLQ